MSKIDMNRHGVYENVEKRARNDLVSMVFQGLDYGENQQSRVEYQDIPVDKITPRSINRYKQNRIDRLARSIKNTNNRLIHPIVVVRASDLPENHEVIVKFRQQGVDVEKLDYILVAGERRYRAWQKLRADEEKRIAGQLGMVNQFDFITANVLTKKEAKNESAFFEDSNLESRQLTPLEGILHIQDALSEVDTPEKKRQALIEMAGGDETGIPEDPDAAARKFNTANYCAYYLAAELGIEGWSKSTIKTYLSVVNNCCEEVKDAIIAGKYSAGAAREITGFSEEEQLALLTLWLDGKADEYKQRFREIEASKKQTHKTIRYTHRDARKQLDVIAKKVSKERRELKLICDNLGGADKDNAVKALKKVDGFLRDLDKLMETLK